MKSDSNFNTLFIRKKYENKGFKNIHILFHFHKSSH